MVCIFTIHQRLRAHTHRARSNFFGVPPKSLTPAYALVLLSAVGLSAATPRGLRPLWGIRCNP